MSNETITPERIALPKQVVLALEQTAYASQEQGAGARMGARIALAALANTKEKLTPEQKDKAVNSFCNAGLGALIDHLADFLLCEQFLAPKPKLPEEVRAIVSDSSYASIPLMEHHGGKLTEFGEMCMKLAELRIGDSE